MNYQIILLVFFRKIKPPNQILEGDADAREEKDALQRQNDGLQRQRDEVQAEKDPDIPDDKISNFI